MAIETTKYRNAKYEIVGEWNNWFGSNDRHASTLTDVMVSHFFEQPVTGSGALFPEITQPNVRYCVLLLRLMIMSISSAGIWVSTDEVNSNVGSNAIVAGIFKVCAFYNEFVPAKWCLLSVVSSTSSIAPKMENPPTGRANTMQSTCDLVRRSEVEDHLPLYSAGELAKAHQHDTSKAFSLFHLRSFKTCQVVGLTQ